MTLEKFNEIGWRPGMSVVYKFNNVDEPSGVSFRTTMVSMVAFANEHGEGCGIYGPSINGSRVFVHVSQILEVRTGFKYGEKS